MQTKLGLKIWTIKYKQVLDQEGRGYEAPPRPPVRCEHPEEKNER